MPEAYLPTYPFRDVRAQYFRVAPTVKMCEKFFFLCCAGASQHTTSSDERGERVFQCGCVCVCVCHTAPVSA